MERSRITIEACIKRINEINVPTITSRIEELLSQLSEPLDFSDATAIIDLYYSREPENYGSKEDPLGDHLWNIFLSHLVKNMYDWGIEASTEDEKDSRTSLALFLNSGFMKYPKSLQYARININELSNDQAISFVQNTFVLDGMIESGKIFQANENFRKGIRDNEEDYKTLGDYIFIFLGVLTSASSRFCIEMLMNAFDEHGYKDDDISGLTEELSAILHEVSSSDAIPKEQKEAFDALM